VKKRKQAAGRLTDLELEIMNVIWELGETTISEVNQILGETSKKHAYTTTATMMKILEKKKFLKSKKKERAHKYTPSVTKDIYEGNAINHIVDNVFEGASAKLVMKLLDDTKLNREELIEIRKTLESRIEDE
jgi:predicted transcriptional regulator